MFLSSCCCCCCCCYCCIDGDGGGGGGGGGGGRSSRGCVLGGEALRGRAQRCPQPPSSLEISMIFFGFVVVSDVSCCLLYCLSFVVTGGLLLSVIV